MAYSIYDQRNSTSFKPLSYEELIAPIAYTQQKHDQLNESLNQLQTQADTIGAYASEQYDPASYKMYNDYSSSLRSEVDKLSNDGLTPGSMRNFLKLRSDYQKNIQPISNAINARQEAYKKYSDAYSKDSTLVTDINPATISLDEYINNKNAYNFNQTSGEKIIKQVADSAKAFKDKIRETPQWIKTKDGQALEGIIQKGFTPNDIYEVINGNGNPILTGIVNQVLQSSGVSSWNLKNNPQALKRIINYANQGLWQGIGGDEYRTRKNEDYLNPLESLRYKKLNNELNNETQDSPLGMTIYDQIKIDKDKTQKVKALEGRIGNIEFDDKGNIKTNSKKSSKSTNMSVHSLSAGTWNTESNETEATKDAQKLISHWTNNKSLGATDKERIDNGLKLYAQAAKHNYQTYSPYMKDNKAINSVLLKGIVTTNANIYEADEDLVSGKKISDKDKLEVIKELKNGDMQIAYNYQTGNNISLISSNTGKKYSISSDVGGIQVKQAATLWRDAVLSGDEDSMIKANQFFNSTIIAQSNDFIPGKGGTNNKFWNELEE